MTNEERQAWLADRKTGIGATDASAIAGVSPWRSPMDVFLSKLTDHENEPSFRMELGLMLEPVVAQLYANETGYELVKPPKLVRHPERDWQIASLDYWLKDRTRNVELKTTDSQNIGEWGEPGTDEVPEVYLVQIMHQMVVSRIPVTDIGVLFGTKEFRIYTVEYNEALGEQLTIMEQEFWHENILKSIPPSVD
jgi:putative phage-type endonuclease